MCVSWSVGITVPRQAEPVTLSSGGCQWLYHLTSYTSHDSLQKSFTDFGWIDAVRDSPTDSSSRILEIYWICSVHPLSAVCQARILGSQKTRLTIVRQLFWDRQACLLGSSGSFSGIVRQLFWDLTLIFWSFKRSFKLKMNICDQNGWCHCILCTKMHVLNATCVLGEPSL